MNFVSILEEDYRERLDDEGLRVLERIRRGGATAIGLLNELVLYAGVGRDDVQRVQVDMNQIARRAMAEAVSGEEKASEEDFEICDLPPASADPALVERVFTNLFSNALKYSRERDPRLVRVWAEREGSMVRYVVEDNGVGFESDQSERLFDPFARMHSARDYEGSGLGLAIVKKIVRRLGGQILAESDGTSGARVMFSLPGWEGEGT